MVVPRSTARHRCSMAGDAPTRGNQFDVCRATAHPAIRLRSARLAQYRNHHGFPFVQDPLVIPTPSFHPFPRLSMRFFLLSFHLPPLPKRGHLTAKFWTTPLISLRLLPYLRLIRLSGDRPLLLAFHANEYDRVPFETSISIPSNRSCFLSLSLSFLHGYLRIRYSFSEPHLPPLQRVVRKKKNSLLVEHPEWRKVEGNERGKARPSCMPVNWSGERCWIGGPVVGVNVWNCFSRGHQEPFGVTWSRRALSGKAGGRGGGLRKPLKSIASRYCRRHPDQAALRCICHPPPSSSILIYLHVQADQVLLFDL